MECRTAQLLLQVVAPRTGELDPVETEALEKHLAGCPACAEAAGNELTFNESIGRVMRDVPVPFELHSRLISKLAFERSQLVRRVWFRRARQFSAAAAILLSVWLGFAYWKHSTRPVADIALLADEAVDFLRQPWEVLEKRFATECGIKTVLPKNLNNAFLVSAAPQVFQGTLVPRLAFHDGAHFAEVLVLNSKQFDLKASLRHGTSGGSGGLTFLLWQPDDEPNTAFLIRYTGNSLDWLLVYRPDSV